MMSQIKNNVIKQVVLLLLIALLFISIIGNLSYFIPGMLGAVTLYILIRDWYFRLVEGKKWKPWLAALLFIFIFIIAIALPIYGTIVIMAPMFNKIVDQPDAIKEAAAKTIEYINTTVPQLELSTQKIVGYLERGLAFVPGVLQSTASLFANIFTALFILYFMLVQGRAMENLVATNIPLYKKNKNVLWLETKNMVVSNALGIPMLALAQGIIAVIGYWIFGVPSALIWALLTAFATVIPVIGTMIIWVPICIFLLASGHIGASVGLALYCFFAVGGIDNVLRLVFVKMFGDVHPLITLFGVLLGLELFGVIGLIFGPLMISYLILMIKIYKAEFSSEAKPKLLETLRSEEDETAVTSKDRKIILPGDPDINDE
ncbi:MAG: AI-2E family transporter [Taibaiella sp.]|nr:AI-2E family transporter [Taibaiella sp.]